MAQITWKTSDDVLNGLRAGKVQELKEACGAAIYAGFTSTLTNVNGVAYQFGFNEHDQANFTQQLLLIVDGQTTDVQWKTKNAGVVTLTTAQFKTVINDSKNHKMTQQSKYWDLEGKVKTATSKADLDLIKW